MMDLVSSSPRAELAKTRLCRRHHTTRSLCIPYAFPCPRPNPTPPALLRCTAFRSLGSRHARTRVASPTSGRRDAGAEYAGSGGVSLRLAADLHPAASVWCPLLTCWRRDGVIAQHPANSEDSAGCSNGAVALAVLLLEERRTPGLERVWRCTPAVGRELGRKSTCA